MTAMSRKKCSLKIPVYSSTVGSPSVDNGVGWGGMGGAWASKLQVRVGAQIQTDVMLRYRMFTCAYACPRCYAEDVLRHARSGGCAGWGPQNVTS